MPTEPTTTQGQEQPAGAAQEAPAPVAAPTPTSSQETSRRFLAGWNAALNKDQAAPAAEDKEKTEPVKQDAPVANGAAPAPTAQAEDTEPTAQPTTTPTQPTTQQPAESAEERATRLERELSELKAAQERQRVQGQTLEIQKAHQQAQAAFQKQVAPLVEQADELADEYNQALADGEQEQALKLAARWNVLNNTIQQQQAAFQQGVKQLEQQFHQQRRTEHEQTLAAALKKQGLDYEEIRKAGGEKFDPTNPYAVLETALRVATDRHKVELEEVKTKSKTAVEEARKKWTLESPASRTRDAGATSGSDVPRRNLSTSEQIGRGLQQAFNK